MCKRAGINMLAKIGKDKPVSMEAIARIDTVLKCGSDDIFNIIDEAEMGKL